MRNSAEPALQSHAVGGVDRKWQDPEAIVFDTMSQSSFLRRVLLEGRASLMLAVPLIAGQVSQMLVGLADTVMIGRLGVVPLAAATFANTVLHLPLMFGIGITMAVSIRVSQARGANQPSEARGALRHGLLLGLLVGLLSVGLAYGLIPFLGVFGQEPAVTHAAGDYFVIVAFSMIPAIGSMAVKNHADAMNHPWPAFWILLGGVVLNILMNWVLIWGHWGTPALGLEGAGLATLLARTATLGGLIWWTRRSSHLSGWVPLRWWRRPDWLAVRSLVKVGLPASLQLLAEIGAFVAATILIGTMSKEALASHQVAISCAATVFMFPLGLSMALTVRMGAAYGAGDGERLRPMVVSGWFLGLGFTSITATCFLLFNGAMAGWFLTDPATREMAAMLLTVSAAFQCSDALQILSGGALRGLNDVSVPAWIAVFAYWVISLPLGWWFAFPLHGGVAGIWWGITIGLTFTAVVLGGRLWVKTTPQIEIPEGSGSSR